MEMQTISYHLFNLVNYTSFFVLAPIFFLLAFKKLTDYAKNPNDLKNTALSPLVLLFAGSLLLNVKASSAMFINSLNSTDNVCFIQNSQNFVNDKNCFDDAASDVTKHYKDDLESRGKTQILDEFNEKISLLYMLFQSLGMIYFVKGILLLKAAAEGVSSVTYSKILIMIICSSFVIDMPNTMDMLIETAKKLTAT